MQSSVSALGFGHPWKQDPLNMSQWLLLHVAGHLSTHPGEYFVLSQPIKAIDSHCITSMKLNLRVMFHRIDVYPVY